MAGAFNLTAQLNLRGPSNVGAVVSNIKKQLGSVNANVNVTINPATTRNVTQLNSALRNLNSTFGTTTTSARNAAQAITAFGNAINRMNIGNVSKNLGAVSTSLTRLNSLTKGTTANVATAASEMQEFGRQAGLAVRRFAGFSIGTAAIFSITNAINKGVQAFIEYDKQFVKLQQVTGESAGGLQRLSNEITSLSTGLGVASVDLTNIASTLAQAGLNARDTEKALRALALSALAPSFDSMNETVEGSIALMRQFGIGAGDLEGALGSVNSVAAKFAVEAADIITAIQRTGGVFAAASKGVSEGQDALNEFIAVFTSVRATTRESAETIATGLRTIFTRIQRGGTIEALKEYGVNLQDLDGKFVGAYKAVQLLSEGLTKLDPRDVKFSKIVEELGGFRQIGKVIPLIQQFATAQEALVVAQKGQGSLAADAAKAQDSLANKIVKVREEFFALFKEIGKSDSFQTLVRGALDLASAMIKIADSVKGVLPALTIMAGFKGVSALTSFGAGFASGVRPQVGARKASGGYLSRYAVGGTVREVPVALTPGEAVIYPEDAMKIGPSTLRRMNNADRIPRQRRASGGRIGIVPGSGNTDSHYTTLPEGSFVIRKAATQAMGPSYINDVVTGRQKFAKGGLAVLKSSRPYVKNIDSTYDKKSGESIEKAIRRRSEPPLRFNLQDTVEANIKRQPIVLTEQQINIASQRNPKAAEVYTNTRSATGSISSSARGTAFERILDTLGIYQQEKGNKYSRVDGLKGSVPVEVKSKDAQVSTRDLLDKVVGSILYERSQSEKVIADKARSTELNKNPNNINIGDFLILEDATPGLLKDKKTRKEVAYRSQEEIQQNEKLLYRPKKKIKPQFAGEYVQKLMAGELVKSRPGRKTRQILSDITMADAAAYPASKIIGELGVVEVEKILASAGVAMPANKFLRQYKLDPQQQRAKQLVISKYVEKINAKAAANRAGSSAATASAASTSTLFGAIGMFGSAFPPEDLQIITDPEKPPITVRAFGAVLDKNKIAKNARLKEREDRLKAINTRRNLRGKSQLIDTRMMDIKAAPTAAGLSKQYLKEDLSGISKRTNQNVIKSVLNALSGGSGTKAFFDFDKTLAFRTNPLGYKEEKVIKGQKVKNPDYTAFGDISKVEKGLEKARPSMLLSKLVALVNQTRTKMPDQVSSLLSNIHVVTARPQNTMGAIGSWLNKMGLPIPLGNIRGVGGSGMSSKDVAVAKANTILQMAGSSPNLFVDDDATNIAAAQQAGIKSYSYGLKLPLTKAVKKAIADSQGSKFQNDITSNLAQTSEGQRILGAMNNDTQQRSIDFPYGIGMSIAKNWFNNPLLASIPVDAKRTLTGPRGKISDNIKNFLKARGFFFGGMVQKLIEGGAAESGPDLITHGGSKYLKDDVVKAMREVTGKPLTPDEAVAELTKRNAKGDLFYTNWGIPGESQKLPRSLMPYKGPPGLLEAVQGSIMQKQDRIAEWKRKRGLGTSDYEGRTTEQKTYLRARGRYADGGSIYKDIKNKKAGYDPKKLAQFLGATPATTDKQKKLAEMLKDGQIQRPNYEELFKQVKGYSSGGTPTKAKVAKASRNFGRKILENISDRSSVARRLLRDQLDITSFEQMMTANGLGPGAVFLGGGRSNIVFKKGKEVVKIGLQGYGDSMLAEQMFGDALGITDFSLEEGMPNVAGYRDLKNIGRLRSAVQDRVRLGTAKERSKAAKSLQKKLNKQGRVAPDLHEDNVGFRGKDPVIIDSFIIDKKKLSPELIKINNLAAGGEIPIMAQEGEYIINRNSARAIGYHNLERLNKYHTGGKVQALAKGGPTKYDRNVAASASYSVQQLNLPNANSLIGQIKILTVSFGGLEKSLKASPALLKYLQTSVGSGAKAFQAAASSGQTSFLQLKRALEQDITSMQSAGASTKKLAAATQALATIQHVAEASTQRLASQQSAGLKMLTGAVGQFMNKIPAVGGLSKLGNIFGGQGGFFASMAVGALAGQGENLMGKPTTGKQAGNIAAFEGGLTTVSTGLSLATGLAMIPGIGPVLAGITALGTGVVAAADFIGDFSGSAAKAAREFDKAKNMKKIEDATDLLSKAMSDLAKDMDNVDLQNIARQRIKDVVEAAQANENVAIGERKEEIRTENVGKLTTMQYIGSFFNPSMYRGGSLDAKQLTEEDYKKIGQREEKNYQPAAQATISLFEQRMRKGESLQDIYKTTQATPEGRAQITAIERSNPEQYAKIKVAEDELTKAIQSGIPAEIDRARKALEVAKSDAILNNATLKSLEKTIEAEKAMDAANKAGRRLADSYKKLSDVFNDGIGRLTFDIQRMDDATSAFVNSLTGDAKIITGSSKNKNILENPLAYTKAEREASLKSTAQLFGPAQESVGKLLNFNVGDLTTSIRSGINEVLANNAGAGLGEVADQAKKAMEEQISGLPEEAKQQIREKFNAIVKEVEASDAPNKADALAQKMESELGSSVSEAADAIKKTAILIESTLDDAFKSFGDSLNAQTEALLRSAELTMKATEIREQGQDKLNSTLGFGNPDVAVVQARQNAKVASLTGGLTDPGAIRQDIQNKSKQAEDLQKKANEQRDSGDLDGAKKTFEQWNTLNQQIQSSTKGLDILANSSDVASAALGKIQAIMDAMQGQGEFLDKLATATPEEAQKLNDTFIRLQNTMNGQLNTARNSIEAQRAYIKTLRQTGGNRFAAARAGNAVLAQQRGESLALFKELIPVFRSQMLQQGMTEEQAQNRINNMYGRVTQGTYAEAGLLNNPMLAGLARQTIQYRNDPRSNPAISGLMGVYDAATQNQAQAVQEQASLEQMKAAVLFERAVERFNEVVTRIGVISNEAASETAPRKPRQNVPASGGPSAPGAVPPGQMVVNRGGIIKLAAGGLIPTKLTPRELVIEPEGVNAIGLGNLEKINTTGRNSGGILYRNSGGLTRINHHISEVPGSRTHADTYPSGNNAQMLREGSYVLNEKASDMVRASGFNFKALSSGVMTANKGKIIGLRTGGQPEPKRTRESIQAERDADSAAIQQIDNAEQERLAQYESSGQRAEDLNELAALQEERASARQESWLMDAMEGRTREEGVNAASSSYAESQVGQGTWMNMTAEQRQAEIDRYQPRFQQLSDDYEKRQQEFLETAGPYKNEARVNFFRQEQERTMANFNRADEAVKSQQERIKSINELPQEQRDRKTELENRRNQNERLINDIDFASNNDVMRGFSVERYEGIDRRAFLEMGLDPDKMSRDEKNKYSLAGLSISAPVSPEQQRFIDARKKATEQVRQQVAQRLADQGIEVPGFSTPSTQSAATQAAQQANDAKTAAATAAATATQTSGATTSTTQSSQPAAFPETAQPPSAQAPAKTRGQIIRDSNRRLALSSKGITKLTEQEKSEYDRLVLEERARNPQSKAKTTSERAQAKAEKERQEQEKTKVREEKKAAFEAKRAEELLKKYGTAKEKGDESRWDFEDSLSEKDKTRLQGALKAQKEAQVAAEAKAKEEAIKKRADEVSQFGERYLSLDTSDPMNPKVANAYEYDYKTGMLSIKSGDKVVDQKQMDVYEYSRVVRASQEREKEIPKIKEQAQLQAQQKAEEEKKLKDQELALQQEKQKEEQFEVNKQQAAANLDYQLRLSELRATGQLDAGNIPEDIRRSVEGEISRSFITKEAERQSSKKFTELIRAGKSRDEALAESDKFRSSILQGGAGALDSAQQAALQEQIDKEFKSKLDTKVSLAERAVDKTAIRNDQGEIIGYQTVVDGKVVPLSELKSSDEYTPTLADRAQRLNEVRSTRARLLQTEQSSLAQLKTIEKEEEASGVLGSIGRGIVDFSRELRGDFGPDYIEKLKAAERAKVEEARKGLDLLATRGIQYSGQSRQSVEKTNKGFDKEGKEIEQYNQQADTATRDVATAAAVAAGVATGGTSVVGAIATDVGIGLATTGAAEFSLASAGRQTTDQAIDNTLTDAAFNAAFAGAGSVAGRVLRSGARAGSGVASEAAQTAAKTERAARRASSAASVATRESSQAVTRSAREAAEETAERYVKNVPLSSYSEGQAAVARAARESTESATTKAAKETASSPNADKVWKTLNNNSDLAPPPYRIANVSETSDSIIYTLDDGTIKTVKKKLSPSQIKTSKAADAKTKAREEFVRIMKQRKAAAERLDVYQAQESLGSDPMTLRQILKKNKGITDPVALARRNQALEDMGLVRSSNKGARKLFDKLDPKDQRRFLMTKMKQSRILDPTNPNNIPIAEYTPDERKLLAMILRGENSQDFIRKLGYIDPEELKLIDNPAFRSTFDIATGSKAAKEMADRILGKRKQKTTWESVKEAWESENPYFRARKANREAAEKVQRMKKQQINDDFNKKLADLENMDTSSSPVKRSDPFGVKREAADAMRERRLASVKEQLRKKGKGATFRNDLSGELEVDDAYARSAVTQEILRQTRRADRPRIKALKAQRAQESEQARRMLRRDMEIDEAGFQLSDERMKKARLESDARYRAEKQVRDAEAAASSKKLAEARALAEEQAKQTQEMIEAGRKPRSKPKTGGFPVSSDDLLRWQRMNDPAYAGSRSTRAAAASAAKDPVSVARRIDTGASKPPLTTAKENVILQQLDEAPVTRTQVVEQTPPVTRPVRQDTTPSVKPDISTNKPTTGSPTVRTPAEIDALVKREASLRKNLEGQLRTPGKPTARKANPLATYDPTIPSSLDEVIERLGGEEAIIKSPDGKNKLQSLRDAINKGMSPEEIDAYLRTTEGGYDLYQSRTFTSGAWDFFREGSRGGRGLAVKAAERDDLLKSVTGNRDIMSQYDALNQTRRELKEARAAAAGTKSQNRGGIVYANNGAFITAASKGSDRQLAMLTEGEYVVSKPYAAKYGGLLNAINTGHFDRGGAPQYLANGGIVGAKYYSGGGMVAGGTGVPGVSSNSIQTVNGQITVDKQVGGLIKSLTEHVGEIVGGLTLQAGGLVKQYAEQLEKFNVGGHVDITSNINHNVQHYGTGGGVSKEIAIEEANKIIAQNIFKQTDGAAGSNGSIIS